VDTGMRLDHVLTMQTILPESRYPASAGMAAFHHRVLDGLRGLPGVESAGCATHFPLGNAIGNPFSTDGKPPFDPGSAPNANISPVGGDYFRTLGIAVLAGRGLTDRDAAGSPPVAVIDRGMARRFFAGEDPIGR